MAVKKNTGWKFKDVGISVDSQVIRKLPKNPKNMNGMKKGQGQLPSGFTTGVSGGGVPGVGGGAAEGLEFAAMLMSLLEASEIEDITDEQPVTSAGAGDGAPADPNAAPVDPDAPVPLDANDPAAEQDGDRYVKGAHLVAKKQVDATDFEEIWIYRIDPNAPDQAGTILKAILAGTDIPENKSRSDDGKQSYSIWTAGNAQYVHITGLSN